MKIFEQIQKTREYLNYIENHVLNVQKAWTEITHKCKDMRFIYDDFVYNWIGGEIEEHDLSKMSEQEFVQYRKAFYPAESEGKYDMSKAWEHHKDNNPHHWENWTKKDSNHPYEWEVHCVHMIVDWMAMGYKFGDTAEQYYESNRDKINLPDYAVDFIYEIFKRLRRES
ncbi:MAG: DUF5662 family protein [Desulforhopalus sp.]